jgi:hypothetical protein
MPSSPVLVAEYESDWNGNVASKTVNPTVVAGDLLAVVGITPDQSVALSTPTGGGLTYNPGPSVAVANFGAIYMWTATVTAAQSFTLQVNRTGSSFMWGFNALRLNNTAGPGASNTTTNASGAPSLALTANQPNSGVIVANVDWVPVDGSSRAWRTPTGGTSITNGSANEPSYFFDASNYTIYIGWHSTVGAAGSKTVGLSAPAGQKYAIAALEILGRPSPARPQQLNAVRRAITY